MKHMKSINDRLARELHDKIVADLNETPLKKVEIARKWGLPERCIGDVAERAGIDLKQRRVEVTNRKQNRAQLDKIERIAEAMARSPERIAHTSLRDLEIEFDAQFYVIDAALKLAGIERVKGSPSRINHKKSDYMDKGMAGALSREWLTYNWGCRPGPRACSYYHGRPWA